jgi:hypothetical protein
MLTITARNGDGIAVFKNVETYHRGKMLFADTW